MYSLKEKNPHKPTKNPNQTNEPTHQKTTQTTQCGLGDLLIFLSFRSSEPAYLVCRVDSTLLTSAVLFLSQMQAEENEQNKPG